ncbi:MAG TPA: 50S ribosomal protein L25, partial [Acidimicrobiales bacterium]|nr:50S ribosomal protein L25 [Acidimicrobiales bacterium]
IQRHPSRNVVTHVDFQIVRRDEVISAEVGINLVGEAVEVAHGDGIVEQQLFYLAVKAKPADIPATLELDISELTIGSSLHVTDIRLPSGVELETDPETTVVTGQPPRVQTAEEAAAEGAEAAEGEAGAAEGGEAATGEGTPGETGEPAESSEA